MHTFMACNIILYKNLQTHTHTHTYLTGRLKGVTYCGVLPPGDKAVFFLHLPNLLFIDLF